MNFADYTARHADHCAQQAFAHARSTLEGALAELDRYIERYGQAESLDGKADILHWTLNHLATYVPANIRLDLLARAQAETTRANTMKE